MPSEAQTHLRIGELRYPVLQMHPDEGTPQLASAAVARYLGREHPALAGAVEVEPGIDGVVLRARGEAPEELLGVARSLLCRQRIEPIGEIEVDVREFEIEVTEFHEATELSPRELLRSEVRYFPFPECEWFEISSGELAFTEQQVVYEPELVIMEGVEAQESGRHIIPLAHISSVYRGEWWDVPCLMIESGQFTWRYGWAARRGEPELVFDVDEWILLLRERMGAER